ncbi:hypothetical protein F5Y16DRAFT_380280 [Xylariaceae sp. FL0255]|nr:hypothetical protein F5Y16DRAFT_380280 [Xylariaceae sp. FL0255]
MGEDDLVMNIPQPLPLVDTSEPEQERSATPHPPGALPPSEPGLDAEPPALAPVRTRAPTPAPPQISFSDNRNRDDQAQDHHRNNRRVRRVEGHQNLSRNYYIANPDNPTRATRGGSSLLSKFLSSFPFRILGSHIWTLAGLMIAASGVLLGFAIAENMTNPVKRQLEKTDASNGKCTSNSNTSDPIFWQEISLALLRVLVIICLCVPVTSSLATFGSSSRKRHRVGSGLAGSAPPVAGLPLHVFGGAASGNNPNNRTLRLHIPSRTLFLCSIALALLGEVLGLVLFALVCGNGGWMAELLFGWAGGLGTAAVAAQLAVGLRRA